MKGRFIFLFVVLAFQNQAQNLVANGSFEEQRGRRYTTRPWRFTNTVDVFVSTKNNRMPKGTEKWNVPPPRTGKALAGFRVHSKYRELLQIRLNEKLEENRLYLFEMFVRTADESEMLLQTIGASFYHRKPAYTYLVNFFKYPPQINYSNKEGIQQSDTIPWIKIRGYYRAKGGERYLSIGNFEATRFKNKLTFKRTISPLTFKYFAYYYVDDISLVKTDSDGVPLHLKEAISDTLSPDAVDSTQLAQDTGFYSTPDSLDFDITEANYIYTLEDSSRLVLEKIRFEFGSAELLPYSFEELELVLEYLNTNRFARIKIIGHTDNIGNADDNLKLSKKRAQSVYNYFIDNRIAKDRLSYEGKGEKDPIASNEHAEGRNQNRRVEIVLLNDD